MSERQGMLLVISGPSGTGKGTLAKALVQEDPSFCFSVSATTRAPRKTETPGVDYHFISEEEFDRRVKAGNFLEWAKVHEHRYGTLYEPLARMLEEGKNVLLDIDPQGAQAVKQRMGKRCVTVFLIPPSYDELRVRLHTRNTDDQQEIERRLHNAYGEIDQIHKYQYVFVNDTVSQAMEILRAVVAAEKHSTVRYHPVVPGSIRE